MGRFLKMTSNKADNNERRESGKTIDLQGVASFASLVELLGQELGTMPGRIQGLLPQGPASFEELVGEIRIMSQGFQRSLVLRAKPGSPLTLRFNCAWRESVDEEDPQGTISGIESHFLLDATVEEILPQGRALARYVEDIFGIMDQMVTLGHSNRLSSMSVSASQIAKFEQQESGNLVSSFAPKRTGSFDLEQQ
jgi:hypothetical protein